MVGTILFDEVDDLILVMLNLFWRINKDSQLSIWFWEKKTQSIPKVTYDKYFGNMIWMFAV